MLLCCIIIDLCLGGLYAWSVFVPPLISQHNYSASQTQSIFGLCIVVNTMTMIFAGRILDKLGFRVMIVITGGLFMTAYLLASLFCNSYMVLLFAMGLVFGLAIGFGYITVLSLAARLFPDKSGMACGAVVAGYGCGAIMLSNIAEKMLSAGDSVPQIFKLIAITYGTAIILCGLFLDYSNDSTECSRTEKLPIPLSRDQKYWTMVAGMFAISFPGLMIIGNLKPIGLSYGHSGFVLKASMLMMALGNSSGRIIWGGIYDRFKNRTILMMFAVLNLSMIVFLLLSANKYAYCLSTFFVVFGFSSCAVVYPANVAQVYGGRLFANVYPLIIVFHGAAGLMAGLVSGLCYDKFTNYNFAIMAAIFIAGMGMLLQTVLCRNCEKDINYNTVQI
ncbi:MAG: MFS transporter [Sedimentisphaeraceae bacterium JB056]